MRRRRAFLSARNPGGLPSSEAEREMKVARQSELVNLRRQASLMILKPLKHLLALVLRTILASLVFYACVVAALYGFGYPVPRMLDLQHYLGRLSELAEILS